MPETKGLCLVIMPFGKKKDATGKVIDFEAVYRRLVVPAVEGAGLKPVRAEEERTGCLTQRSALERLRLCEYALADLSTGDAKVFYELGVRQAVHPTETALIYAAGGAQLPLDVHELGAIPYRVSPFGLPLHEAKYRGLLTARLGEIGGGSVKSPVYRTVQGMPRDLSRELDWLATRETASEDFKKRVKEARLRGASVLREIEEGLAPVTEADPGAVTELFLAYRAVSAWPEMIDLTGRMAAHLKGSVLVQEQLGLALAWAGRGEEGEQVLRDLITRRGPSSESYGILGRILKDRWEKAQERGETALAKELLQKAATAYLKGFEADWSNTYPGVNAVTLMELKEPADPRRREILPVVHYAVEQRIRAGAADYWDYATLLELAALACDEAKGVDALGRSLARVRESWEPLTTARDLKLIREARQRRGADCPSWTEKAEAELLKAAERGTARP